MVAITRSALALLALQVFGAVAAKGKEDAAAAGGAAAAAAADAQQPEINIDIETKFPEADIFGLKLINGRPTKAIVQVTNHESEPVRISFLGGAILTTQALPEGAPPSAGIVANLTAARYDSSADASVATGETKGYPYNFVLDLQPRDVKLELLALVTNGAGQVFQIQAHSGTATIVDPPINILDPQIIFLYVFLTGLFGATLYFVYNTWIAALFPQAKRPATGRKARKTVVATETAATEALSGNESTGAATGTDEFDPNWIPSVHLAKPVAKRVGKGGAGKKKVTE